MEVLSEHCCEGWLEGYLLTGRHGVWATYEGFAQVVDSMLTQHGKWLEQCEELPWRRPIASLNIFLTSHCWRNDHNGFSHQAPGFVDNALARRSTVIRIYYPPDANTLLSTMDHCLRSRNYREPRHLREAGTASVAQHGRGHRALLARRVAMGIRQQ